MNVCVCKECRHFRQHYTLDQNCAFPVNCGHCTAARIKHRKAAAAACDRFVYREKAPECPDKSRVVHFLTTEVLKYILSLKLPPEITPME